MANVDWSSLQGKPFKVDVNTSVVDAVISTENNVIYFTKEGKIVFNGVIFSSGVDIVEISQEDYDAIEVKDDNVLYLIS